VSESDRPPDKAMTKPGSCTQAGLEIHRPEQKPNEPGQAFIN